MKKLISTAALGALLASASPAFAADQAVKLGMTGYFKGYMVYNDQDEQGSNKARKVDIIRDGELHFVGSSELDNGLTVGADIGATYDQGDSFDVVDSFVYFSGAWGRVNFGATDGAAYLLQVSAPSADANYDGMDQYFSPFRYSVTGATFLSNLEFDYDQDITTPSDKITYITPMFSGFQAGVSYTPDVATSSRAYGVATDDVAGANFGDAWDLAGRYTGEVSGMNLSAGAGYTMSALEKEDTTNDDRKAWNVGANVGFDQFTVGLVYTADDLGLDGNFDQTQWVAGVDYKVNDAYKLGASYLNQNNERGGSREVDTDRYTGGVTYTAGPGIDFRGVVSHISHDVPAALGSDVDGTSVMLGTSISF
jgi:outer membrane protein OmpU